LLKYQFATEKANKQNIFPVCTPAASVILHSQMEWSVTEVFNGQQSSVHNI